MNGPSPIHVVRIGTVAAAVYRRDAFQPEYWVELSSERRPEAEFAPEELPMVRQAVDQSRMFICYQEQLARMNWCPGCGDG